MNGNNKPLRIQSKSHKPQNTRGRQLNKSFLLLQKWHARATRSDNFWSKVWQFSRLPGISAESPDIPGSLLHWVFPISRLVKSAEATHMATCVNVSSEGRIWISSIHEYGVAHGERTCWSYAIKGSLQHTWQGKSPWKSMACLHSTHVFEKSKREACWRELPTGQLLVKQ